MPIASAKQSKFEMAMSSPSTALPDVLDDASLKDSQKALSDLQARVAQLIVTFTPQHAEVRKVQAQISSIEASLTRARGDIVTRLRNDFDAAQRREKLLDNAYQSQLQLVTSKAEELAHYNLIETGCGRDSQTL